MMSRALIEWALSLGQKTSFMLNRRLLIGQTHAKFSDLDVGVRAAEYDDLIDFDAAVQICSIDTEHSRVVQKGRWPLHEADLVLVDEAHLQKTKKMKNMLRLYRERGAKVVFLSATPIAMQDWADCLVVSGGLKDFRKCGALVPIVSKHIGQPDLSKVKRSQSGEYTLGDKLIKEFTQHIVNDVVQSYETFNASRRPAGMYAPCVNSSMWLVDQMAKRGHRFCHIDANYFYLDGDREKLTRERWDDLCGEMHDGTIHGFSNRLKAREGIDLPWLYHGILACPIGSLASYIQTGGRFMRAYNNAPHEKDHALITDHGGVYHTHGSVNEERPWDILWRSSGYVASQMRRRQVKDADKAESIVCPKCKTERIAGHKCPTCGFEYAKSKRRILMEDGTWVEKDGAIIGVTKRSLRGDSQNKWNHMYYGYRKKKLARTFIQMEAFFKKVHGYYPERSLNNMPTCREDWHRHVHEVNQRDLR